MNFPLDALNQPRFNAMALLKLPIVSPVDSLKLDGIDPNLKLAPSWLHYLKINTYIHIQIR